jgi:AraC-like DNA-binding protein
MAHALDLSLRSYAPQTLRHSHAHHQIVLPLAGVLEMEVGGKGGHVAGCQAALIAAGRDHSCEAAGENRFVVLDWMADESDDSDLARLSDVAERRPFLAYDPGLQNLLRFLGGELRDSPAASARGWGALLLSALAARAGAARPASSRQLGRAIAYIHANPHRQLTVRAIAAAACCSPSHLHALFQHHLGSSPKDYTAEVRLDKAMALLFASDASTRAIALDTGHADQSVLTRSMKRRRGITPAAYRRSARPVAGQA